MKRVHEEDELAAVVVREPENDDRSKHFDQAEKDKDYPIREKMSRL